MQPSLAMARQAPHVHVHNNYYYAVPWPHVVYMHVCTCMSHVYNLLLWIPNILCIYKL